MKTVNGIIVLLFWCYLAAGNEQITADPNMPGCSIEYHKVLQVKVGELIEVGKVRIGGFLESRNEYRFNQGLLPNHNWRGFLQVATKWPLISRMQYSLSVITAVEHESAHATMGIVEPTDKPFELIYDHSYRLVSLNAARTGVVVYMFDHINSFMAIATADMYVRSKNTPELPGLSTATAPGAVFGGIYRYRISGFNTLFIAVHERIIGKSKREKTGTIYIVSDGELENRQISYPVINSVATFSLCCGVALPLFKSRQLLEIYGKFLFGHTYGYVDSRDDRAVFAVGISVRPR